MRGDQTIVLLVLSVVVVYAISKPGYLRHTGFVAVVAVVAVEVEASYFLYWARLSLALQM